MQGKDSLPVTSLRRIAVRWFTICGISSVPSFCAGFAIASSPTIGMVAGIVVFALCYTALDRATVETTFRRNRMVSRTLKFTYGTRVAITVVFPVGFSLDLYCGIVSTSATRLLFGSEEVALESIFGAFVTTLIQGCVLNFVLAIYAVGIFLAQAVWEWGWKRI